MIVVTTPTGGIGRQVLQILLDAGAPSLRVIDRDPARLDPAIADRVEIVAGSHGDPAVVDEAFRGADSVFWLAPPEGRAASLASIYVEFTRPAAEAIQRHGVKRVVSVTAVGRRSPLGAKAGHVTASLAMDDLLAETGAAFRGLAASSFMDNILRQVAVIRDQGHFFLPLSPDLRLPTVATADIASVAAQLLRDETWTGRDDVPVLGPEDLSANEMAAIMSDVLGRHIAFQQMAFEAFKARCLQFGMSEAVAQGMDEMYRAKDQGIDLSYARNPAYPTPTSFRQWCEAKLKPAVLG